MELKSELVINFIGWGDIKQYTNESSDFVWWPTTFIKKYLDIFSHGYVQNIMHDYFQISYTGSITTTNNQISWE